ncbi:hypothetical protein D9757_008365 [Collybiopsis confluens]|uniref:Uncharacterized protein n=1 Tax=Collybiopsis confluens TaxID=2823264 RepID=A0A8H5HE53_9AGAR|nr:hypothetical protein D9757_008365 [Collybiopsis confluens]
MFMNALHECPPYVTHIFFCIDRIPLSGILFTRWASVASCDSFLKISEEPRRHYGLWCRRILRFLGLWPPSSDASNLEGSRSAGLPPCKNNALSGFKKLKLIGIQKAQRASPSNRNTSQKHFECRLTQSLAQTHGPPSLCTHTPCTPVAASIPLYVDSTHLDAAAAAALSKKDTSSSDFGAGSVYMDRGEDDEISIPDAHFDPRATSLIAYPSTHPNPPPCARRTDCTSTNCLDIPSTFFSAECISVILPNTTRTQNASGRK